MSNEDLYTHSSYGFHVDSQEQLNRLLDEADKVERGGNQSRVSKECLSS